MLSLSRKGFPFPARDFNHLQHTQKCVNDEESDDEEKEEEEEAEEAEDNEPRKNVKHAST